jgi:hypothetical protein
MSIFDYDKNELNRIQSSKDPILYQVKRKYLHDHSTMNRTIIVNWADETTKFGCRFHCQFCSWKDLALKIGDIDSNEKSILKFLEKFEGYKVTISGGGDPIFKWEQNSVRLKRIITILKEEGYLVEVISKELDYIQKNINHDQILSEISHWNFSLEKVSNVNLRAIEKIYQSKKAIRISKVCSPGSIKLDILENYINEYLNIGVYNILLREDFYHSELSDQEIQDIKYLVQKYPKVIWLPTKVCLNNLFLINDVINYGDISMI